MLPLLRLRIVSELIEDQETGEGLPVLPSVPWRGAMGAALKAISDGTLPAPAPPSWLARSNLFEWLFRGSIARPADPRRGDQRSSVQPWVLSAQPLPGGTRLPAGYLERLDLTLVGKAAELLPLVLISLESAAAQKQTGRSRRLLKTIQASSPGTPDRLVWDEGMSRPGIPDAQVLRAPPLAGHVRIRLETPLQLRVTEGGRRQAVAEELEPVLIFERLFARLEWLARVYCGRGLVYDRDLVMREARRATLLRAARHPSKVRARWSRSTEQPIVMSGIVGWLDVDLGGSQPLWELLWTGQHLHLGKNASSGLGAYSLAQI